MKKIVGITGTTCVGKSEVAVILAKRLNAEVVSADSMQIYRGMDIGTAKISEQEMQGVPHYMIDVVNPNEEYSSFEYSRSASKIIDGLDALPIVVGGTGFYFDSLLYPPEFGARDKHRRFELQEMHRTEGLGALCELLKRLDEDSYNGIDLKNPVRVIRAIEIAEGGGKRADGKGKVNPRYDCKLFVLQKNRQDLFEKIDRRVDEMVERGLVAEVQRMIDNYGVCNTSAFSAIGYKEIIAHLQGNCSLVDAIEQIKLHTRHYAKRQLTYFKKMNVCRFVDVDELSAVEAADVICKELEGFC